MSEKTSSVHYINYLQLDKVLDAQHLISDKKGGAAHEESIEKEERIQIKTNNLLFDKPINKKKYDEVNLKVVNPIIPEPIKTSLIGSD